MAGVGKRILSHIWLPISYIRAAALTAYFEALTYRECWVLKKRAVSLFIGKLDSDRIRIINS